MEAKKQIDERRKPASPPQGVPSVYDFATPRWSEYYKQVRKSIRFPRYYKKALNW